MSTELAALQPKIHAAIDAVLRDTNHFTLNELDVCNDQVVQVSITLRKELRFKLENQVNHEHAFSDQGFQSQGR